jgi:hypothetical protein
VSTGPSKDSLNATSQATAPQVFEPLVITSDRAMVLARLTFEANQHFGHARLAVSNVRVTAMDSGTVLASATFTPRSES